MTGARKKKGTSCSCCCLDRLYNNKYLHMYQRNEGKYASWLVYNILDKRKFRDCGRQRRHHTLKSLLRLKDRDLCVWCPFCLPKSRGFLLSGTYVYFTNIYYQKWSHISFRAQHAMGQSVRSTETVQRKMRRKIGTLHDVSLVQCHSADLCFEPWFSGKRKHGHFSCLRLIHPTTNFCSLL